MVFRDYSISQSFLISVCISLLPTAKINLSSFASFESLSNFYTISLRILRLLSSIKEIAMVYFILRGRVCFDEFKID